MNTHELSHEITDDDELESSIEQRMALARAEWLNTRAGETPGAISDEQVVAILLLLAKHKVPPTVRAVREVYGSGSPNVITPMIRRAWINGDLVREIASEIQVDEDEKVPTRLRHLWQEALKDAGDIARKRLASRHEALEQAQEELQAMRAGLDKQMEAILKQEQLADARVSEMQAQVAMLEVSANDLRGTLARQTQEVAQLKRVIEDERNANQALREENTRLAMESQQAQAALQIQASKLESALRAADAGDKRVVELTAELGQSRAAHEEANQRAAHQLLEKTDLQLELAESKHTITNLTASLASAKDAQAEATALRADLDQANRTIAALRTDLLNRQRELDAALAERTVMDHIQQELEASRQQLQQVMRDRDQLLRNPPALLPKISAIEEGITALLTATREGRGTG